MPGLRAGTGRAWMLPFLAFAAGCGRDSGVEAPIVPEDPSPEEAYAQIVAKFEGSKTVRVRFVTTGSLDPRRQETLRFAGTLILGQGNRARFDAGGHDHLHPGEGTGDSDVSIRCDGVQVKSRQSKIRGRPAADLRIRLGRTAASGGLFAMMHERVEERQEAREPGTAEGFRLEKGDGPNRILRYRAPAPFPAQVELTFEAGTCRLLRRVVRFMDGDREEGAITEVYEECSFDVEVPDETFRLPSAGAALAVFPETDVLLLTELTLKASSGIVKEGGLLNAGTLEFEGAGEMSDIAYAYYDALKERGWKRMHLYSAKEETADFRKDDRRCDVRVWREGGKVRALIKVGPRK